MTIKKLDERKTPITECRDPQHGVPTHIYQVIFDRDLPPGLYEHECPNCGLKIRFRVGVDWKL